MLHTPTLAGARVPKNQPFAFNFLRLPPDPLPLLKEVARKWLVFSGSLHHYKTVLFIRFATWRIRSLFLRDSRTGCYLQRGVLRTQSCMCLPQAPAANAAGAPPMRADGEQSSLLPNTQYWSLRFQYVMRIFVCHLFQNT